MQDTVREAADPEELNGFAFGQTEPLTTRLHGLIREYPEGLGIVKELLQNADDSGARLLHIIIDWRPHPTNHLPDPRMAALQGPALLAFNDRKFTEEDIQNIQQIGHGGKVKSAAKTGRFGLGFNAVYNVTDWPSLITGGRLVYFDPHLSAVPGATPISPGYGWKLGARTWAECEDLLLPFLDAGLPRGAREFEGTIFRLSFRTPEQAEQSLIRHKQPFERRNVEEIIEELLKTKEQLLLFLKSIEELRVSEIKADGTRSEILSIATTNVDDVRQSRQKLLGQLAGKSIEVLERLEHENNTDRLSIFSHSFQITTRGRMEVAKWQIVSGLFADAEGKLIDAARQMAQVGEKAVPWAGVAARLEGASRRVSGTVYCSLPLPIESGLPVHLHGFFDLDSSRSALTVSGGQTGADRVRGEWNRLLLRHGVAAAYAQLIASLAPTLGESSPRDYYGLWPVRRLNKPFDELEEAVAKQLADMPVIRTAGEPRWARADGVWVLPSRWDALQEPLVAEGLPVSEPPLSPRIREFLKNAGVTLDEYSPEELRAELSDSEFSPVALDAAPRPCLRQRDWLVVLLRFCLTDESTDLRYLPLALLANGQLRVFGGDSGTVYLADARERRIFDTKKEWFLDDAYVRDCGLSEVPEAGIQKMTPEVVVEKLAELIPIDDADWIEWDMGSKKPPNAAWLTSVYQYLTRASEDGFKPDQEALQKLALVPARGSKLFSPAYASTPLLARDELDENTRRDLAAYGVLTIDAPPPLRKAISAFADAFTGNFIWPLTGPDVVDTLDSLKNLPDVDESVQRRLLEYLADRRWLEGDCAYDDNRLEKLRNLPIFLTTSKERVAIVTGVFRQADLSTDIPVPLKLLKSGHNDAWLPLYELLEVPLLDRSAFIQKGLLPGYEDFDQETKLRALHWVRDNLDQTETELEDDENAFGELLDAIKQSELILCADGEFRAPANVYDPESKIVNEVLGTSVPLPDMGGIYASGASHWLRFFRRVGMIVRPSAVDIVRRIDKIMATVKETETTRGLSASLLRIYSYVTERWDELNDVVIPLVGGRSVTFAEALRVRRWLPVERNPKELERYAAFVIPEDRLFRPGEVRFSRQGHLAATQHPIFRGREPDAAVREELAFTKHVSIEEVLAHFNEVVERWQEEGESLDKKLFGDSLDEIYRELERVHSKAGDDDDDASANVDLPEHFAEMPCIWHQGKFWKPEHSFQVKVPFFGARRVTIPQARRHFYEPLGMRTEPESDDYISFIEELADAFGSGPLPLQEQPNVIEVFRRLGRMLADAEPDSRLYVLTDEWRFVHADDVFSPDAAWLEPRLDRPAIQLLHRDLRASMERAAGVKSLAQSVVERPEGEFDLVEDGQWSSLMAHYEAIIRSPEFCRGIERLIWNEDSSVRPGSLLWLASLRVQLVREIVTELYAEVDGAEQRVGGGGTTDFYFDQHNNTIFLAVGGRRLKHHLVKALANQIEEAPLHDLAPLIEMLECNPEEIDTLLDDLRVRRPPEPSAQDEISEFAEDLNADGADERDGGPKTSAPGYTDATSDGAPSEGEARSEDGADDPSPSSEESEHLPPPAKGGEAGAPTPRPFGDSVRNRPPMPSGTRDSERQRQPQPRRPSGPPASDQRRRDRVVTYVGNLPESPVKADEETDAEDRRWKVQFGAQAVERVCAYEREHRREPEQMGQTSPGYDVKSLDPASGQTRFIEVKAINGGWSPRGVGLSATQFAVAQDKKDAFWLYVVEHANAPESAVVHPIQDPASKITEYRFDDGWRDLASGGEAESAVLSKGLRIIIKEKGEGMVEEVRKRGALDYLEVALDSGETWKGAYNPSTMKILD
jgi:sacsin